MWSWRRWLTLGLDGSVPLILGGLTSLSFDTKLTIAFLERQVGTHGAGVLGFKSGVHHEPNDLVISEYSHVMKPWEHQQRGIAAERGGWWCIPSPYINSLLFVSPRHAKFRAYFSPFARLFPLSSSPLHPPLSPSLAPLTPAQLFHTIAVSYLGFLFTIWPAGLRSI